MSETNKVYALSQNFMNVLHDEWLTIFANDKKISDYLIFIKNKYSSIKSDFFVKGDTGVYYDREIIKKLNTENNIKKAEFDFYASKLLYYGANNNPGLYKLDENGNKEPLDYLSATDPRIWNYLSLFLLNDYSNTRWGKSKDKDRVLLSRFSNEKSSRHSITRLYWAASLCADTSRSNKFELLEILWKDEDFMSQITERSTSNNKLQIQWFLEFCMLNDNSNIIFKEKCSKGYPLYRYLLKLFIADDSLYNLGTFDKEDFYKLFNVNLIAAIDICKK
jgi:hypothetical protein